MVILGMDTDAKGSVAVLDCRDRKQLFLDVYAIPNRIKLLKSGTKRLEVDFPALAAIMGALISSVPVDKIYLEDQWSRPSQDSGATFTFGKTFGDCRTATAAALLATGMRPSDVDAKIVFVPGGVWKFEMRLDSDKSKSLSLADRIFPDCSSAWKLKSKHTSAAEASLLALYGATKEGVVLPTRAVVKKTSSPILREFPSLIERR